MNRIKKLVSLITLVFSFLFFNFSTEVAATENVNVQYRTHVQSIGWQPYVTDGAMSGTSGKSLRLEGIDINLQGNTNGGLTYQTHVQSYGWQNWVSTGEFSGTQGEAKRLEAIRLKLTGQLEQTHDVYYRVHVQSFGWLDWAKNGAPAGSAGYAYRLEGIEIRVVPKGSQAPGATQIAYKEYVQPPKPVQPMKVNYTTHVQSYGWQSYVSNGAMSGTEGKAKRLEGIKINLSNPEVSGGIQYRTHVQSYGWQEWKTNDQMSGTTGEAKRLEAIQMSLTGNLANYYDVYYRVHAQTFGWMGWAKNGESAGTSGFGFRLEGIEIRLVEKGNNPPGTTANAYRDGTKLYVDTKGNGLIKGSSSKIYHLPGSQYYSSTTSPRAMFKTELQAIKAGYRPTK